jgi:dynein heavy chain
LNIFFCLEHFKFALNQEVREWILLYGQSCNIKYKKEMTNVFIFIEDIEKRLSREIKDLEDIRLIMIAVKDLRENEIRIDMNITPIEESYAMLQIHALHIPREEIEQSDSLRYRWGKLQNRCVRFNLSYKILF